MSSAKSTTALVFSSEAGTEVFTRACIHGGASLLACADQDPTGTATARQAKRKRQAVPRLPRLITGRSRSLLKYDLLFIAGPHQLIERTKTEIFVCRNKI